MCLGLRICVVHLGEVELSEQHTELGLQAQQQSSKLQHVCSKALYAPSTESHKEGEKDDSVADELEAGATQRVCEMLHVVIQLQHFERLEVDEESDDAEDAEHGALVFSHYRKARVAFC